ncbi:MAG: immunoglobulin domain-containing protein [Bacteroidales bacterium]|nr:immunoglobulin domain-containing protein [Bacteroidales bacterium]
MKRSVYILAILFYCTLLSAAELPKACESDQFSPISVPEENTTFSLLSSHLHNPLYPLFDHRTPDNPLETTFWVFAGNDTTICLSNQWFPMVGSAGGYWFVFWTTAGDGFFSDANLLSTNYFPGTNDKLNGQVRLFLTVYQSPPDFQSLTDTVNVSIVMAPQSNAGPDASICETDFFQVTGQADHYNSLIWTTTGDGYFNNPLMADVIYYPGANDIAEASAVLCLIAFPNSPCALPSANCMTLFIQKIPLIENLNDTVVCRGSSLHLTPSVFHCDSVSWSTAGDGYFSNPFISNPTYYPGEQDMLNGQVVLQLSGVSGCICIQNVTADMTLTIQPHPQVYQMPDQVVCIGDTIRLEGGGIHYETVYWLSYGDGYFDNPTILNPKYVPGEIDIERGMVILEIIAEAIEPCNFSIGAYIEATIHGNPDVNAGDDQTGCEQIQLDATALHYESLIWSTSGDGTFSDIGILNPVYHAGMEDLVGDQVLLMITALPLSPCMVSQSDQLIFFTDKPKIISETIVDQTVYSGENLEMGFFTQSYSQGIYTWFHNGMLIPNSNSSTLMLNQISKENAGTYYCEFENDCGKITSSSGVLTVLEPKTQVFSLPAGWCGFSSFVIPSEPSITTIFQPVIDQLVIVMTFEGTYWPGANVNTLCSWDASTGYMVKMNSDELLTITGFLKYPVDPVILNPGWSLLPVKISCPLHVEDVFGGYSEIVMIKEISGIKLFWPAMQINSLEYLEPGKSYYVYKSGMDLLEVPLPECDE